MTERQKTYAYALAAIVAAVILWLLFFKRDIIVGVSESQTPYNYFDGIPQMTATGIPVSHSDTPHITINSAPGSVLNTGGNDCGCGCGGCGEGGGDLTTFANFLNSLQPQASVSWIENMPTYEAPTIKSTVRRAAQEIFAPLRQVSSSGSGLNFNTVW